MIEYAEEKELTKSDRRLEPEQIDPDATVRGPRRERQWDVLVVIGIGGVLGAEARFGLAELLPTSHAGFPWATILTNSSGCLLIGILMVVISELTSPHRLARPFLGIGVLGGYTTFSTFAVDVERLLRAQEPVLALAYLLATLTATALAVAAGTITARLAGQQLARSRRRRSTRRERRVE